MLGRHQIHFTQTVMNVSYVPLALERALGTRLNQENGLQGSYSVGCLELQLWTGKIHEISPQLSHSSWGSNNCRRKPSKSLQRFPERGCQWNTALHVVNWHDLLRFLANWKWFAEKGGISLGPNKDCTATAGCDSIFQYLPVMPSAPALCIGWAPGGS